MELIRITSDHFCAGLELKRGVVILAAPILKYMTGWSDSRVLDYTGRKGWLVEGVDVTYENVRCQRVTTLDDGRRILECHSRGAREFSPFFAYVEAFGVRDSIENHYQKSKLFIGPGGEMLSPSSWRQAKYWEKRQPFGAGLPRANMFQLPNGWRFPVEYLVFGWYASLWLKHLDQNPKLVQEARLFDDYNDPFKGDFPLCQADCIRLYAKSGREALLEKCQEFLGLLRSRTA